MSLTDVTSLAQAWSLVFALITVLYVSHSTDIDITIVCHTLDLLSRRTACDQERKLGEAMAEYDIFVFDTLRRKLICVIHLIQELTTSIAH